MPYRPDPDLRFLADCSDEDLDPLVQILRGPDGDFRIGQGLTSHAAYKAHYPKHSAYWMEIAEELQRYGGNSIATAMRGWRGVPYSDLLADVCRKLKIGEIEGLTTSEREFRLLAVLLERSIEGMSEAQREVLLKEFGVRSQGFTAPAVVAALQTAVRAGGFLSYQIVVVVANAVAKAVLGRGLSLATNAAITRTLGVALGPVGWSITALWTAIDLAGPSYRVTIPCCVHIAFLRAKETSEKKG